MNLSSSPKCVDYLNTIVIDNIDVNVFDGNDESLWNLNFRLPDFNLFVFTNCLTYYLHLVYLLLKLQYKQS